MATIATIIEKAQEQFRLWFWRGVAVLLLMLIFFVVGGGISQHEEWKIANVEVSGARVLDPQSLESSTRDTLLGNYYWVYARSNSYIYPKQEIERTLLEKFPRIASTTIERTTLQILHVTVSEREPFALWCGTTFTHASTTPKHCQFLDQTGFVFDEAPTFSPGVYLEFYGPLTTSERVVGNYLMPLYFKKIEDLVKNLASLAKPTRATINTDQEVTLTLQTSNQYPLLAGVELRFDMKQNPKTLAENLLAALAVQFPENTRTKKKLQYIDLRFDNKVFFGFEN